MMSPGFKTPQAMREAVPGRAVAERAAAVGCYLLPNPLKGKLAQNRGEFVQHHFRQAVGVSVLLVCFELILVVLFFANTAFWLLCEKTADHIHIDEWLRRVVLVLIALCLAASAAGILIAAGGSRRRIPLVAKLGDWKSSFRIGVFGGSSLALVTLGLATLAIIAPNYARPLEGKPAALYVLYDETQAPRWVVTLLAFPMNHAANHRWGSGSVIVAPINRHSLREALAHGKVVYLATHGENGPMLYREGSLGPQDVAQGMAVGSDLRLVYLAACHGGDMADQWKKVLAPAEVISYPRFSAHLEHAYWLWVRLPRFISGA